MEFFDKAVRMNSFPQVCREHSAAEWEDQRQLFQQLYRTEDKTLKEVMSIMETKYGFHATERQYKQRIKKWNLDKNIKDSDMKVIARKTLKRKTEGNKQSEFMIHGHQVQPHKIEKYMQRKKACPEEILASYILTPPYICCLTPPSTADVEESVARVRDPGHQTSQLSDPNPLASTTSTPSPGLPSDHLILGNMSVVTHQAPVSDNAPPIINIFGLGGTFTRKPVHQFKLTESCPRPCFFLLRKISLIAHNLISWYEVPEKFNILKLLHDLGKTILAFNQQGLDNKQKGGYSLLYHEVERSRLTINEFFTEYCIMYQTLKRKAILKRDPWTRWVQTKVPKLEEALLPQIESIKLLTLVDQMAQLGTSNVDRELDLDTVQLSENSKCAKGKGTAVENIGETIEGLIQRVNIDISQNIDLLEGAIKNQPERDALLDDSGSDIVVDESHSTKINVDFMTAYEVPWIYLSCLSRLQTGSKSDRIGMQRQLRQTWTCCGCENGGPYEARYVLTCLECYHAFCDECEISIGCNQCGLSF